MVSIKVLNSPWDVCYDPTKEVVYIAMAGQHQIWEHNTLDEVTRAFSGDGYERNLNGSRYPFSVIKWSRCLCLLPNFLFG